MKKKIVIDVYIVGSFYKVGGIDRMKRHLARVKGEVPPYKSVPYNVRFQMRKI
jgi:hypothetical protein